MKDFNNVPMFRPGLNELTDGLEVKATEFCKKKLRRKSEMPKALSGNISKGSGKLCMPSWFCKYCIF